ncbi:TVP38/TMEM64 family protein [Alphaproteobacteria bacterium]|nr:TVP38/TMEM64 family protein [Alphaproteobacteria bacterium]
MKIRTRLKKIFTPKVIIILALIIAAIVTVAYFWGADIVELFSNPDKMRDLVASAGPFGPVVFVALQTFQVVFAPIPGNVTGAVGGVVFGWWGLPLTVIGSALGMIIVVALARRFGRPMLERFFKAEQIKKFDFLIDAKAELALFLIFLFPFFPDDLIGYLAGLTGVRFRTIILISIIGRLPTQVVTNFFGGELFEGNIVVILVMLAVMAVFGVALWLKRQWLHDLVRSENHLEFIKNSFRRNNKVK